ncbi:MAG: DUF1080 domain-containing protein [bacterium]
MPVSSTFSNVAVMLALSTGLAPFAREDSLAACEDNLVARRANATIASASAEPPTASAEPPTASAERSAKDAPRRTSLFDAMAFETWRVVGGRARFEVVPPANGGTGPTLVGRGPIERNGFLASPRALGDFRLSVEVRLGSADNPQGEKMNSGIQIRSRETDGTIAGLQIEVDPTPRRWSGGVYDERGRGWLASLADDAAAQAAFRLGEWNTYDIECIGPRVRTKVNGIPCAEWYDGIVDGLLAFQVHGGPPCEVAFRAPVLEELGVHTWTPFADAPAASSGERVAWTGTFAKGAVGLRLASSGGGRLEIAADDEQPLAVIDIAPITSISDGRGASREATAEERARVRRIETVWSETAREGVDGAVLVDGARVTQLSLTADPRRVRFISADARVERAEQLLPKP